MPDNTTNSFMDVMKRSKIRVVDTTSELITSYEWDFRFTKIPQVWANGELSNETVKRYMELFRCRTNSVVVPEEPQQTPVSVMIRGHQFSQPGMSNNFGQFSFVLQDFADTGIQKELIALQYAMSLPNSKGMKAPANKFFFNCELFQLDSERRMIKKWICTDCLLILANVVDTMDSSKTAVGQTSVAFSTDFYTIEYPTAPTDVIGSQTYYYSTNSASSISQLD